MATTKSPNKNVTKKKSAKAHSSFIFLMPNETETLCVQYDPMLRFTAIIPAAQRKIHVGTYIYEQLKKTDKFVDLNVPPLLLHQMVTFKDRQKPDSTYRMFGIDVEKMGLLPTGSEKPSVKVRGLVGRHIEPGGKVCFGSIDAPRSLRHFSSRFWGSTFVDNDLVKGSQPEDFKCYQPAGSYLDFTHQVFGKNFVIFQKEMAKAIFVTTDPEKMKKFSLESRVKAWDKKLIPGEKIPAQSPPAQSPPAGPVIYPGQLVNVNANSTDPYLYYTTDKKNQMTAIIASAIFDAERQEWSARLREGDKPIYLGKRGVQIYGSVKYTAQDMGKRTELQYQNYYGEGNVKAKIQKEAATPENEG